MKRTQRAAVCCLVLACLACAGRVGVEFDPTENFSGYETWAWLDRPAHPLKVRGLNAKGLHEEITAAVERELELRGYRRSEGEPADFYVTYHAKVERELVITHETPAAEYLASMHDSPSYLISRTEQRVQIYDQCTLVIDFADGSEQQLVWRGAYERRLRGEFRSHIDTAVERILERFPPVPDTVAATD